jgi:hypothetical protein
MLALMGQSLVRSVMKEISAKLDALPPGRHVGRQYLRQLVAKHLGLEARPPVPYVKPGLGRRTRRKRVQAALEAALGDPLDTPLPPAPSAPAAMMWEALAKRAADGVTDRHGRVIDLPPRKP